MGMILVKVVSNRRDLKLVIPPEEDILLIETRSEGRIDHAEHVGPFIAHFDERGRLLLLEILEASEVYIIADQGGPQGTGTSAGMINAGLDYTLPCPHYNKLRLPMPLKPCHAL
mgnify:CR=1 FL=1